MRRIFMRKTALPKLALMLLSVCIAFSVTPSPAFAASNPRYAAIIVNATDGNVLFSRNADARRYPASLTKMMTLYMLFEELEAGRLTLNSNLPVSATAASRPPSKLGMRAGSTISVEIAIKALAVKSANDVAAVVAEKIGKTESGFATLMTAKAKSLGLTRTKFLNASGLPNSGQYTTARDMAMLGQRIFQDFPQYYHYFSIKSFTWSGRVYKTHNRILKSYTGADGIKTGYIRASGFNVVTSAKRGGFHLIGVVMGGRTSSSRDEHMKTILSRQFVRLQQNPSIAMRFAKVPTPIAKPLQQPSVLDESLVIARAPDNKTQENKNTTGTVNSIAGTLATSLNETPKQDQDKSHVKVASASLSAIDPIGQLIDRSQNTKAIQNFDQSAAKANTNGLTTVDPSDPLSPRIIAAATANDNTAHTEENAVGIQVGAFRYEEVAVQRLSAVMTKAPEVVGTQTAGIFPVSVGGRTLYRVRIGPYRRDEAQSACEALTARGVSCYPVFKEEWPKLAKLVTN